MSMLVTQKLFCRLENETQALNSSPDFLPTAPQLAEILRQVSNSFHTCSGQILGRLGSEASEKDSFQTKVLKKIQTSHL